MTAFNSHVSDNHRITDTLWYSGTDAVAEGEPLCYGNDEGSYLARPSQSNCNRFAGVALRAYSAKTTGQLVEIAKPGSKGINVKLGEDVSAGDYVTFTLGSTDKEFIKGGFLGCGTGLCTDAGTDTNLVQVDLQVGDESGGIETIDPEAGANTVSAFGVTLLTAQTLASAAAITVADPVVDGQKKAFKATGTMTTSDVEIDLATASLQPDFSTALAAINAIDADGDGVVLEARGGKWYVVGLTGGATLSAT